MNGEQPLPAYSFRPDQASLWTTMRQGIGDVASIIPAAILTEPAVQLAGAMGPLVVASPQLAREVLNDRDDCFTRDRFVRRMFRRSWGQGLAGAEGEEWQRQRRAAAPFFTPKSVNTHLRAFAAASDAVIDQLEDGETVELGRLAARIVARIVLTVLVDAQGHADPDVTAVDVAPYVSRITGFTALDLLPLPERIIDRIQGIDTDPAVVRLRELGTRLAETRGNGGALNDMIALLDGKGPLADNIRGLFPAAMDTTVTGLAWALHTMALRSAWQARVTAEGRTMGDIPASEQLAATRRVVSEVLRLYPPAPLLARCAARKLELGGYKVSRGQTVLVGIYPMQRHGKYWDRPDAFDPDRFLPERGNPVAFMPFGTGPRMCIAAQFAHAEMTVILARVLARLRVEPAGPAPIVSLQTTTRSINGIGAVVWRR